MSILVSWHPSIKKLNQKIHHNGIYEENICPLKNKIILWDIDLLIWVALWPFKYFLIPIKSKNVQLELSLDLYVVMVIPKCFSSVMYLFVVSRELFLIEKWKFPSCTIFGFLLNMVVQSGLLLVLVKISYFTYDLTCLVGKI